MKINEPVTNNEVKMKEGSILVSKTDLKGIITYCNKDFIEISGFKESELIGKNHNLVRHPDMPPAAFDWLWDDIKAGKPWTSPVKNRAKNGDYYWVNANVSPVYKNGEIVEYISVRTRPSEEEIESASQLYQSLNDGTVTLEKTALQNLVAKVKSISTVTLQYAAVVFFAVFMMLMASLLLSGFDTAVIANILIGLSVACLVFGVLLVNSIKNAMGYFKEKLYEVSNGQFFNWTNIKRSDDIGDLLKRLFSVQVRLAFDVMDARENIVAGERIQTALDNTSGGIMVVDSYYKIIYLNKSLQTVFNNNVVSIKKDIKEFDPAHIIDQDLGMFFGHSSQHKNLLDNLKKSLEEEISFSGKTLRVVSAPVYTDGERSGTIVEWKDLTEERALESEIEHLVIAAQSGDLSSRLKISGTDGFFNKLSISLNEMLDVLDAAFSDINIILSGVSSGELGETIDTAYDGVFGEVKDNVNTTISRLRDVVGEIRSSSSQINTSSQEIHFRQ